MNIYSPFDVDSDSLLSDENAGEVFASKFIKSSPAIKDILLLHAMSYLPGIATIYRLQDSQSADLSRIVRDVLLADIFIGNMVNEIEKRLAIPHDTAKQIRDKIISDLFAPAIEDIKKIQKDSFSKQAPEASSLLPKSSTDVSPNNIIDLRDK